MKKRIISIITALALCLSLCPTWAFAAEADPALCKHHPAHTEDCGYTVPAEGQPCGHEHTDECYTLGALPDTDSGDYYEIGADTENLLDCQHTHDSECGYAQADPGQPCGYECRICPIEDLIAALPDKVTEDNADEVRAQLDEILALFSVLTEDEQEQIDLSRCYELQGALDGAKGQPSLSDATAYKADGTTPATTFGVGETIIIKATPAFPTNGAVMAAAFTEPTGEQMAVYYNDTQISAPSTVENSVHTMTVDTSNLPPEVLNKEIALTVKYIESGNVSGAQTEVKVTVTAVAKVEKDSATTLVDKAAFLNAFKDSTNNGVTITMLNDVELAGNESIRSSCSCTLDLNGHTIRQSAVTPTTFSIGSGSTVTIKDSGTGGEIRSGNIAIGVSSGTGTVSIESGTVSGSYIGVQVTVGSVNISGTAVISGDNNVGLLVERSGSITISGGTFSGVVAVQVNNNASVTLKDMLATGYAYHQNDIPVAKVEGLVGDYEVGEVPLDAKPAWLTGTVTVKECQHNGKDVCTYTHTSGATTHQKTCLACGNKWDEENCSFDENGKCACEAVLAVALKDNAELTYTGEAQTPEVNVTVDGIALAAGKNYTGTYTNKINAGDTAKATVTGIAFTGTCTLPFTIKPATPTIAWNPYYQVLTYTGQPADIKPVITLVNGETYDGPIYYTWPGFTNQLVLPTDAGFNGITASIPAKGNYTAAETEQVLILQINKANQDAPSAPTAAEENIKGNRITLDTIENAEYKRDEGEWQTSPVFTGLDPNHEYTFYVRLKEDKNHNASPSSAGAAITTKKTMLDGATVTVSGSYTYTGAAVVPAAGNVTVELNGVTIDASQYTISATNNVNVGTSTLTVTATADGNYSGSASTTFTISPATLTIKASDQTITYGQSITEGTGQVTATGLCAGDSLSSITLAASTRNVPGGTIELSAAQIKNSSGGDVTANYNITYEAGTLTINKAQATVTGDPTANTLTYTGAAQALVTAEPPVLAKWCIP